MSPNRDERAELVPRQAVRNVDMPGWHAAVTPDGYRIHLDGGSVSIDLGLTPGITAYIADGIGR